MPRELNCPDCNGTGSAYPEENDEVLFNLSCDTCKNGKITVYTQEELNKAVQEEREACANVCDSGNNLNELGKREIITLKRCAEAIRARGK